MTEPTQPAPLPALTNTSDWFAAPDWSLQIMADSANDFGIGFAVTLFMPWGRASGLINSAESYFEWGFSTAQGMIPDDLEDGARALATAHSQWFEKWREQMKKRREESQRRSDGGENEETTDLNGSGMPGFIHLSDVTCYSPAPVHFDFLRVKIQAVTGWTLGRS
ncbi:hypothetical protein [Williamsia deligens]|uniref:Uncharacterized protein n=1 Tax=Williamsia deligens TaxID=321325 RepID=A0ABW3G8Q7_9NOCA|nr:hypothetical protein [Williamsia deligens]MCP2192671.1 hypothetical protein [Williamsia deligens]